MGSGSPRSLQASPWPVSADLNRARRERDLSDAVDTVSDVIVVGGGVTGAGIALDAASRGLDVTLLEARDLAYGTSRWSSKLIHGGLRYLARGDVAIAWESARERHVLMTRTAPHLVRALAHVVPHLADESVTRGAVVRAGLAAADGLRRMAGTPRSVLPGARGLSHDDVMRLLPALDPASVRGGSGYWDGQLVDDARLVVALARTAAAHGARIVTRARVLEVSSDGVRVHNALEGGVEELRARHVIIAAGVWAGQWDAEVPIRLSRGTHVLLDPVALGNPRVALTVPVPGEHSRFVFALPQADGPVLAGLTDVPADDASPDDTAPPSDEVDWILDRLSTVLATPLGPGDVVGAFAGYRPLVAPPGDTRSTADVSRRHLIHRRRDGVVIVTGGKLTTYRRMAADALDAISDLRPAPSRTADIALVGAEYRAAAVDAAPTRLVERYGGEALRIAALAEENPAWAGDVAGDVADGHGVLRAEIVHAIRHEGALTVDDLVQRRTRLSLLHDTAAAREDIRILAQDIDPQIIDVPVDP